MTFIINVQKYFLNLMKFPVRNFINSILVVGVKPCLDPGQTQRSVPTDQISINRMIPKIIL